MIRSLAIPRCPGPRNAVLANVETGSRDHLVDLLHLLRSRNHADRRPSDSRLMPNKDARLSRLDDARAEAQQHWLRVGSVARGSHSPRLQVGVVLPVFDTLEELPSSATTTCKSVLHRRLSDTTTE